MKKLTIPLVIIFTFLFSTTSWGEWELGSIGQSPRDKFYYDKDRIRKGGKYIYFWMLVEFIKPKHGYLSAKEYIELDCSIFRIKRLKIQFYNNSMGEGEVTELTTKDKWHYPDPNTAIESVFNKICEKFAGEKTEIVVNGNGNGVLFQRKINGEWGWYESGDDKKDHKYEGEIKNGFPNGHGKMIAPDGSIFEGNYKDGVQYGQGEITIIRGGEIVGKYIGEIKNNFPDGQGSMSVISGGNILEKYVGEFKNGERNGQGTKTFKDDRKHIGEWKNGKANGKGKVLYPDGRKIIGVYKDGDLDGSALITFPDGRKFLGEFRKNNPWNVTVWDKDGNIIVTFVNGKMEQ